ncbi:MAG TPA: 7-carboxy-7-deazaguanine synthase [Gemmatimonadaceae bacterium]|nr:7-carboxy-7-deazaguanine synthase [Gemmatimonadaceae bacterium]
MAYTVKEIFYTLQGEGRNAGRPAVFCRFSGCNLWTGREQDRHDAVCQFCDTDFVGVGPDGGRFADASSLADAVLARWPTIAEGRASGGRPLVVCTGGEPLLQLDTNAVDALHARGFEVAVETNGTRLPPAGIDHVCVSPKADAPLVLTRGHELKLVYPQRHPAAQPERFVELDFEDFMLQPLDAGDPTESRRNVQAALQYCLEHPRWRLSLQTHKLLEIR